MIVYYSIMTTSKHLYPFGIIGNCSFMSYIDQSANVTWQCWPHFDSSFIFGNLIDQNKGGEYSIKPIGDFNSSQEYLPNTNVLVTTISSDSGKYRVTDFAPRFENFERVHKPIALYRKVEIIEGSPRVCISCRPMGDYGEIAAKPNEGSNSINFTSLQENVRLTTNAPLTKIIKQQDFILTESLYLVLTWGHPLEAPLERTFEDFLTRTKEYWRKWVRRTSVPNVYQDEVIRSALILKLHQFEDTGAIIASGTTSLPEYPGSTRNWDYRYCWIRDSYFTLTALIRLGHFQEAEKYAQWIQNIVGSPKCSFQPVYKIDGSSDLTEKVVPLAGYQGDSPVRVGNDAFQQKQFDVFGQMILALEPLFTDSRVKKSGSRPPIRLIHQILDEIDQYFDQPDSGIWEYRGKFQRHACSYLFHWAGALAAKKIAQHYGDDQLAEKATKLSQRSANEIEKCFNHEIEAYGMSQENKNLNASEFLLITMKYLKNPERARKHLLALEKELKAAGDLIFRYREHDDFGETHATFLICSFWYAEALADIGEVEKSKQVFESLLDKSNQLGIFSEDICPEDFSQWGNIAQTYSHVGLINTAFKLDRKTDLPSFQL